ncbi:YbhB/YbcL family Raf kinase inhibitor-like protein [Bombilactobacillus bombi]|uniref:YbhB/YbcL family Raf kinase inhibitor-like protein n=1 Tax=Bombilactobacillus bombi TaxID=1303590 RepID=A0A417ZJ08_9LACO|nr:YbhB/YbcL family Raf kinase inhibitor-like protein [Bombilactobacillus bombi]RHW51964.1 YbhB/YbcL family Raf kinase inhibitor-like protein [Bombilactobacillus bombi]
MKIEVALDQGRLPAKYGKFGAAADFKNQHPLRSFPIKISNLPEQAVSLALTFVDPDSIPVAGFQWIHWTAANLPINIQEIPENASQQPPFSFIQGKNSTASPYINEADASINQRYVGPTPPSGIHNYELRLYALDKKLDLKAGFWMNELQHAMEGHILEHQKLILPYRG